MKKLLLLLVLLAGALQGFARIVDDEKGFTVGVGLGYWHESCTYQTLMGHGHWHANHWIFSARVGYRITPDIEAGAFLRQDYEDGDVHLAGLGAYGEFGLKRKGRFRLFIDGNIGHIMTIGDFSADIDSHSDNYWTIGIRPGIGYKLKSLPIEFRLRYLFIGFSNYKNFIERACLRTGDWILDAGLRRLEIGAAVTF